MDEETSSMDEKMAISQNGDFFFFQPSTAKGHFEMVSNIIDHFAQFFHHLFQIQNSSLRLDYKDMMQSQRLLTFQLQGPSNVQIGLIIQ